MSHRRVRLSTYLWNSTQSRPLKSSKSPFPSITKLVLVVYAILALLLAAPSLLSQTNLGRISGDGERPCRSRAAERYGDDQRHATDIHHRLTLAVTYAVPGTEPWAHSCKDGNSTPS